MLSIFKIFFQINTQIHKAENDDKNLKKSDDLDSHIIITLKRVHWNAFIFLVAAIESGRQIQWKEEKKHCTFWSKEGK